MKDTFLYKCFIVAEAAVIVILLFQLHACHHGVSGFFHSLSDSFGGR